MHLTIDTLYNPRTHLIFTHTTHHNTFIIDSSELPTFILVRQQQHTHTVAIPTHPIPIPTPTQPTTMSAAVAMNAAGGAGTFAVDDMTRARRFLILGAEGGTYYTSEQALAVENAAAIGRLLATPGEGPKLVAEIVAISTGGRAAPREGDRLA